MLHLVSLKLSFCLMVSTPNFISTFLSHFFIWVLLIRLEPLVTYFFIQYGSLSNLLLNEKEFKCFCLFSLILKSDLHHIFGLIVRLIFSKYIYLLNRLYSLTINKKITNKDFNRLGAFVILKHFIPYFEICKGFRFRTVKN